jgi:hypothetical protein
VTPFERGFHLGVFVGIAAVVIGSFARVAGLQCRLHWAHPLRSILIIRRLQYRAFASAALACLALPSSHSSMARLAHCSHSTFARR